MMKSLLLSYFLFTIGVSNAQSAKIEKMPATVIEEDIYQAELMSTNMEFAMVKTSYKSLPEEVQEAIIKVRHDWHVDKIFEVQPRASFNDVSYLCYLSNKIEKIKVYFNKTGDIIKTTNLCSTSYTLAP